MLDRRVLEKAPNSIQSSRQSTQQCPAMHDYNTHLASPGRVPRGPNLWPDCKDTLLDSWRRGPGGGQAATLRDPDPIAGISAPWWPYLTGPSLLSDIRVRVCAYGGAASAARKGARYQLPGASEFWKAQSSLHPTTSENGIPGLGAVVAQP